LIAVGLFLFFFSTLVWIPPPSSSTPPPPFPVDPFSFCSREVSSPYTDRFLGLFGFGYFLISPSFSVRRPPFKVTFLFGCSAGTTFPVPPCRSPYEVSFFLMISGASRLVFPSFFDQRLYPPDGGGFDYCHYPYLTDGTLGLRFSPCSKWCNFRAPHACFQASGTFLTAFPQCLGRNTFHGVFIS